MNEIKVVVTGSFELIGANLKVVVCNRAFVYHFSSNFVR